MSKEKCCCHEHEHDGCCNEHKHEECCCNEHEGCCGHEHESGKNALIIILVSVAALVLSFFNVVP